MLIHRNDLQEQKEKIKPEFAVKSEEGEAEEAAEGGAEGMCRHPMAAGHVCNQINLHSRPLQAY